MKINFDVWIQFLILFLLITLNYGYLSFNIDYYYLKANTTVNNLTACLIFITYHIHIFSDCIGKIFVNLFQYFHSPSHNLLLYFSPCLCLAYLEKFFIWFTKRKRQNRKIGLRFS